MLLCISRQITDELIWASGGMADASVSKSDICEDVGVQVPPRPPILRTNMQLHVRMFDIFD
jgi:hypothetical protein